MSKKAIYRGSVFDIVNEEGNYITLEGYGYKKRHLKDEVVILDEPEDILPDDYPNEEMISDLPEEPIYDEPKDKSFFEEDEIMNARIADLQQKKAELEKQEALLDKKQVDIESQIQKERERESRKSKKMMEEEMEDNEKRKTMPSKYWNKYDEFDVDVDPETHQETQEKNDERFNDSIVSSLKERIKSLLEELDGVISQKEYADSQINFDPDRETDDVNYNDLENHYSNLEVDKDSDFDPMSENFDIPQELMETLNKMGVELHKEDDMYYWQQNSDTLDNKNGGPFENVMEAVNDIFEYFDIENKIEECGTAAVAGPGVSDGTVNQAPTAEQGIAIFPSRMNIGVDRRKMYESVIFEDIKDFELQLDEARFYNINRHILADKVEEKYDPLNESEGCSIAKRRKARMESIGRYATMKECARFISENCFSCSEGCYKERENKLDFEEVLQEMKRVSNKVSRKVKKI